MAGFGIRPSILESLQPCSHSQGAIPDYTSTTSHSIVLDHVQFFGRTFWRVRKLTLSLTKRRAHIPSIKTAVLDLLTDWGPPLVEMPIEVHIRRIEQYHPRCVACHDMNLVGNHDYVMVYVARPRRGRSWRPLCSQGHSPYRRDSRLTARCSPRRRGTD